MWVQLGEGNQNTNATLLETFQQLQPEMMNLRADNERLQLEQEAIMKILSNKQNQRNQNQKNS